MTERLLIDLAACDRCEACSVGPAMLALRERATFELVCRRCEQASCVLACPFDALDRSDTGMIKRHNLRCVSCKSCALACPFGTIYMELLPFYAMDYHAAVAAVMNMGSASIASSGGEPDTMGLTPLEQCIHGAVSIGDIDADADADADAHIIDKHLAVRTRPWRRVERGEAET